MLPGEEAVVATTIIVVIVVVVVVVVGAVPELPFDFAELPKLVADRKIKVVPGFGGLVGLGRFDSLGRRRHP